MSSDNLLQVTRQGRTPGSFVGGVVSIGNFDGVHRGHQAVIGAARAMADDLGVGAGALTFEPHPRDVFLTGLNLFRLSPREVKFTLMEAAGMDAVIVARFDKDFASWEAERFVEDLLVSKLRAVGVVVGHDFQFGKARRGNADLLRRLGREHGFRVGVVGPQGDDTTVYSSSAVRQHLREGELDAAAAVLGYRWFFRAPVVHGQKRGRDLGYPTANMVLEPSCGLRQGVYAVRAFIDGRLVGGVASFGVRPQFDNGAATFETFFFDYSGDLYGRPLDVTPLAFLRPEARFENVAALVRQMDEDAQAARAIIAALEVDDPIAAYPLAARLRAMKIA